MNIRDATDQLMADQDTRWRLVLVESPYAGTDEEIERNLRYLRACLRDCLLRGEYPFASHAIYTQPGVLNDRDPLERKIGIEAGLAWGRAASKTVVYIDLGITDGMKKGIERARQERRPVEERRLPMWVSLTAREP